MANGELWIAITATDSGYSYQETRNTTEGSVVFELDGQGFQLTADPGIYAFNFTATNFQFAVAAVIWSQPGGNRNLTWASKDRTEFAMTNINYVKNLQTVSFIINPDNSNNDLGKPALLPIDPTVLNNPMPGGSGLVPQPDNFLVQELMTAG